MSLISFKKLFSTFDLKHRYYIIFIFFIFFVQMLLEIFSLTLFIPLISLILDTEISKNNYYLFFKNNLNLDLIFFFSDIKKFSIFFILIFTFKSILVIFCNWNKIGFTYKIRSFLTNKIYFKYLNSPYEDFISNNSAFYLKNINHEISIVAEGFLQFLEFFSEVIIIFGISFFLFYYNYEVSFVIFLTTIISIYLINLLSKKKLSLLGDNVRFFEQFRIQNYIESFNLIKEIKIFGNGKFFEEKNKKLTFNFLQNDFIFRFIKSLPRVLIELIIIFIFLIITVIAISQQGESNHILVTLSVFGAAAYRLMPSAIRVIGSLQVAKYALPSIQNILKELDLSNSQNKELKKKYDSIKFFKKNIKFSNIYFKYKNSSKYILSNLNFTINRNEIVGIKGKTGSGKTTIINLLTGLLSPTSGSIFIDNYNYSDLNIKSLYKHMSYVPQTVYLMDTSIKNNIIFGSSKYKKKDLNEAIKKANLGTFINKLPKGIDTIIGEKSNKISGGQTQRIGIARALIKKPSILILDESTNSLDNETENKILDNIKKLKKELTIILISHNNNSLKICDKVINLDEL
jgi:ABC-type multidrug transport system fused ATPase/permease subunit